VSGPPPVVPGIRCECRLHTADGEVVAAARVFDTRSPVRAMRWIRMGVRTLVSTLPEEAAEPIHEWLLFGERAAVRALSRAEPQLYGFRFEGSRVEFTARPVLYLPLASRAVSPACSPLTDPPPVLAAVAGRGIELVRPPGQRDAPCEAGRSLPDEGEFRG
jgi:hypothetical protein